MMESSYKAAAIGDYHAPIDTYVILPHKLNILKQDFGVDHDAISKETLYMIRHVKFYAVWQNLEFVAIF